MCRVVSIDDTWRKYAHTFSSYAVSQLHCSSTFTKVELILGGCCFKFPDQLGIWEMETGGEIQLPSAITVSVPLSKAAVLNAVIFTQNGKA